MSTAKASLIILPGTEEVLTPVRLVDARTAILRGAAEYLKKLSIQFHGTEVRFVKTFYAWAEPEVDAEFPSAYAWAESPGTYDASQLIPTSTSLMKVGNELYLAKVGELVQDFKIDAFVIDTAQAEAITMMLEDGVNPVTWMYGWRLALPFYHGAYAEYAANSILFEDGDDAVEIRLRHVHIECTGRVPVYRMLQNPDGSVRIKPIKFQHELLLVDPEYRTGLATPEFITYVDE